MVTDTLLIEIGTEELPPKSLNKLRLSLATNMREQLDEAELAHGVSSGQVREHRRLSILVNDGHGGPAVHDDKDAFPGLSLLDQLVPLR